MLGVVAAWALGLFAGGAQPRDGDIPVGTAFVDYTWSGAALQRGGAVTVHWHPCVWANRITDRNRRTFHGSWDQLPNQVGAHVRRCTVCIELD